MLSSLQCSTCCISDANLVACMALACVCVCTWSRVSPLPVHAVRLLSVTLATPSRHVQVPAAQPRDLDKVTVAADGEPNQTAIDAYAPKKPHLDLKRDAAKSLQKLDRATQRAIDELRVELELQQGQLLDPNDGTAAAGA